LKLIRKVCKVPRRVVALREISRLSRQNNTASKSLAKVLRETLQNRPAPEEKAWIERIESLRNELNSSTDQVTLMDYGAGLSAPLRVYIPNSRRMKLGKIFFIS